MNITDFLSDGSNLNVTISLLELQKFFNYTISKTKKELEELVSKEKAESFLSPKQVSEMLDVNLTTLWRWQKRGYLIPLEVGGKRRYRKSDIIANCLTKSVNNQN